MRLKPEALPRTISFPTISRKVLTQRLEQINKIEKAVRARLGDEIEYWDSKAWELNDAEKAGKPAIDSIPPKLRNVPTSFRPDSKRALPI